MKKIKTKNLYDADATETLLIEGITWKGGEEMELPAEVKVGVNAKTLAILENHEENPEQAEETLSSICSFVESRWGCSIEDVDGWFVHDRIGLGGVK